ncbi:AraC family transcriptional regulator [Pedobacter sp. ASV28]|uniref:helix-turn-helix domain-containing protein n=1 Tax=Pedobacter sp. ASV28 TaxID=2795123 RepID=UPI0018EAD964|nr:helix-turn-helix domain-containing protein [Pedobacter sp. ASV28]
MRKKVDMPCLDEGFGDLGRMNVLTHHEIIPYLVLSQPFRSNSFAVIVVQEGVFKFQNNFVKYTLGKGDVYLVTPGSMCELFEVSDDVQFISMGFKKDYLKEQGVFLNGAEVVHLFSSELVHQFTLSEEEFEDIVFSMKSLKKKLNMGPTTPHLKEIIRHSFLSVLYETLIVYSKNRVFVPVKVNRKEELTTNFLMILSDNFKKEKRVQHYAKELCVTSRHLSQVVKQVTGKTAGELIDEMIIKEAKVLLSSHLLNVAQVADELQFSDQSFFGKFFKKYTGISPSIYRSNSTVAINPPF